MGFPPTVPLKSMTTCRRLAASSTVSGGETARRCPPPRRSASADLEDRALDFDAGIAELAPGATSGLRVTSSGASAARAWAFSDRIGVWTDASRDR